MDDEKLKMVKQLIKLVNDNKLDALTVDGISIAKTKHINKPLKQPVKKQNELSQGLKTMEDLERYINSTDTDITEDPDFLNAVR